MDVSRLHQGTPVEELSALAHQLDARYGSHNFNSLCLGCLEGICVMEDPVIQAFTVVLAVCLAALVVLGLMTVRETFKIRKLKAKQR